MNPTDTPHRSGINPRIVSTIQSFYRKTPTGGYYVAMDGYTGKLLATARTSERITQIIGRIEMSTAFFINTGRA